MEAQDYKKLVKALRICSSELNCGDCPLLYRDSCSSDELMTDAANAIESLQAEVGQWKAAVKGQEDGIKVLQAAVKRLKDELSFSESSADEFQMQAALQNALLAKQIPHWVSVKQPPKKNGLYEVFDHDNGVHCAEYRKGRPGSEWTDDEGWCNFRVTHWRELPEPPQEVELWKCLFDILSVDGNAPCAERYMLLG